MKQWMKGWLFGTLLLAGGTVWVDAQIGVVFRDDFDGTSLQPGWVTSAVGGGIAQGTAMVTGGELYFSKDTNFGGGHAHLWYTNLVLNPSQLADPSHFYRITYEGVRHPAGAGGDSHVELAPTNNLANFLAPSWRMTFGGLNKFAVARVGDGVSSAQTLGLFSSPQTEPVDLAIEWGYLGTPGSGFVHWLTNGVAFASGNFDYYDGKVLHLANEVGPFSVHGLIVDAVQVEIIPEPSSLGLVLVLGPSLLLLRRRM